MGRGDIIKLGRIKFNVKDYRTRFNEDCENPEEDTPKKLKNNDTSIDSFRDEFEEEAVEIDCGVLDPKMCPDI